MSIYYVTAKNEKGIHTLVTHETFTDRITTRIEAELTAAALNLSDVKVHFVGGTQKQGSTNTKFNAYRRRNNETMPKAYYESY